MIARALALVFACGACAPGSAPLGEDGTPDTVASGELDLEGLALVDDGPFVALEGPAIVPCGVGGVVHEGGRVEVRTRYCDPADLASVLDSALPAGTMVELELSHDPLLADGGDVHLALVIGDEVVWELERALPTAADFFHERVPLARDHGAGERVVVHVHNHGANSYSLHGVRFGPP